MDRERRVIREAELAAFRERYLESLESFSEVLEGVDFEPLAPDPFSLDIDERTFEDLPPDELGIIGGALREYYGINPLDPEGIVREYDTEVEGDATVPGPIHVTVLKTNHEGVVVQEMRFEDRAIRYLVGRDQDI